jgi:succinate-semialdehyde dehydrogenase / glutarate-semialdehyde dehydrogenase
MNVTEGALRSGLVNGTRELRAPFGGWKLSGVGSELSVEGLMAFRESKHIRIRLRGV